MNLTRRAIAGTALLLGGLLTEGAANACAWEMLDSVRFTTNRGYDAPYDVVALISPYRERRELRGHSETAVRHEPDGGVDGGVTSPTPADSEFEKLRALYRAGRYLDAVKGVHDLLAQSPNSALAARAHRLSAIALYRLAVGAEWRGVATGDARAVGYLESAVLALVSARRFDTAGVLRRDLAHWQCGTLARLGRVSDALFACYEALRPDQDGTYDPGVLPSLRAVWALARLADEKALQARLEAPNVDPRLLAEYITHTVYARKKAAVLAKVFLSFVKRWASDRRVEVRPWVRLRLADLHHRAARYSDAEAAATRALTALNDAFPKSSMNGLSDLRLAVSRARAHALFVRGAARLHLRERSAAVADLEAYLATARPLEHEREARQGLAVLYEKAGRLFAAIEEYEALGYEADVGFLVDFVMKPSEIARYLAQRPNHKQRAKLRFSMGMHFARAGKFKEAEAAFRDAVPHLVDADDRARAEKAVSTYRELAALSPAKETDASLYAVGAFYYHQRRRIFWNPLLWPNGATTTVYSYAFFEDNPEDSRDHDRIRHYFERTNPLWRARESFLKLVKRFPKSELVPKALYSAATATLLLTTFSSYWRYRAACAGFARQARDLYQRVREEFPKHALAADAREWEEFAGKLPRSDRPRHCR